MLPWFDSISVEYLLNERFATCRKQNYVGKIKFASFDTVSAAKMIIVATEENVIAALNLKSGGL